MSELYTRSRKGKLILLGEYCSLGGSYVRMLCDRIQAAVESTLPWWRCQKGVEALDNNEHFACYNVISHKQAVFALEFSH